VVGYSQERKHVKRIGGNWGSKALPPEKILEVTPLRTSPLLLLFYNVVLHWGFCELGEGVFAERDAIQGLL